MTTATPSPITNDDERTATHAIMAGPDGKPATMTTACDLDVAGSLSLPGYTGGARTVTSLDDARDKGVDCLICLGWVGAQLTDPPVVVKGSWFPYGPPALKGEGIEAFTDRCTGAAAAKYLREHGADMGRLTFADILAAQVPPHVMIPYDHTRNRQCSIGYHNECSDPRGESCECPCHRQPPVGTVIEIDGAPMVVMPPGEPTDALIDKILDDVIEELGRAIDKFPGQHLPLGFGPNVRPLPLGAGTIRAADLSAMMRCLTDEAADRGILTWRHVLSEEGFEAFAEDDPARARAELVQLAAMAVRAILDIDDPQPVSFSGPSGVEWEQVGTDTDGNPVLKRRINAPLIPAAPVSPRSVDATEAPGV